MEGETMRNWYIFFGLISIAHSMNCSQMPTKKPASTQTQKQPRQINTNVIPKLRKTSDQDIQSSIKNYDDYSPPSVCLKIARWFCKT